MTEEVKETGISVTSSSDHRASYPTVEHLSARTVRSLGPWTHTHTHTHTRVCVCVCGIQFIAIFVTAFPDRLSLHVRQFALADDINLEFSVRKPDFFNKLKKKLVVRSPDFDGGQGVGSLLPIHWMGNMTFGYFVQYDWSRVRHRLVETKFHTHILVQCH